VAGIGGQRRVPAAHRRPLPWLLLPARSRGIFVFVFVALVAWALAFAGLALQLAHAMSEGATAPPGRAAGREAQ
jgi:hypothetical protein